jgi:hypothetical protein
MQQRWRLLVLAIAAACASSVAAPAAQAATTIKPPAADRLIQVARLTSGTLGFLQVAIGGPVVVAHASDGGTQVFTEPRSGWADEPAEARLAPSSGQPLGAAAISGNDIFAAAPAIGLNGPGAVYVFAKPPGGWSGTVHEKATLIASDGAAGNELGFSLAASGNTIVATGGGAAYVFTEPPGGWSGTIHESAKLTPSDGSRVDEVAISGRTIFAGSAGANHFQGAVYAFAEPAGGWSGQMHQAATLTASDGLANDQLGFSVAASGGSVIASSYRGLGNGHFTLYLFTAPAGGWSGVIHETARRTISGFDGVVGPELAASGPTVAALTSTPHRHECPCEGSLFALDEPARGWAGRLGVARAATVVTVGSPVELALEQRTLAVAAGDGVHIYHVAAPPAITHLSLTGLARRKPRLSFKLTAGAGSVAIKSLSVALPRGLRFAGTISSHSLLVSRRARHSLRNGQLVLTLRRPAARVSAAIGSESLVESAHLLARARHRAGAKALILTLTIRVRDTSDHVTQLKASISVP